MALSEEFLFYGTSSGRVRIFAVADWRVIDSAEYDGGAACGPLRRIALNAGGTRALCVARGGFLLDASSGRVHRCGDFPEDVQSCWFDGVDKDVFMVAEKGSKLHVYVFLPDCCDGDAVRKLGNTRLLTNGSYDVSGAALPLPRGSLPLCSFAGVVSCVTKDGGIAAFAAPPYAHLLEAESSPSSRSKRSEAKSSRRLRSGMSSGEMGEEGGDNGAIRLVRSENTSARIQVMGADDLGDRHHCIDVFKSCLALNRLRTAWDAAVKADDPRLLGVLSNAALDAMDVGTARLCFQRLGDAGMVMSLDDAAKIEEKAALSGYISLLRGDHNRAQELFLSSKSPLMALEMRCSLLEWDTALRLAEQLRPEEVPLLSVRLAQQMEHHEQYSDALQIYRNALQVMELDAQDARKVLAFDASVERPHAGISREECRTLAQHGVARCGIRTGDVNGGVAIALDSGDASLRSRCAGILEEMKQHREAAALFEACGSAAKAMAMRLKCAGDATQMREALRLSHSVREPVLQSQLARRLEGAGMLDEALVAYERARDFASAARVCLAANKPQRAFDLARESGDADAAEKVARFCQAEVPADVAGAIEFLLLAGRADEAFGFAEEHGRVDLYGQLLIGDDDEASSSDIRPLDTKEALRIARYYKRGGQLNRAARFYACGGDFATALPLYLAGGTEEDLNAALKLVGLANNDMLTHRLIDHLMGESNGVAQEPIYIYRLYFCLGRYAEAAATAELISRQEMDTGRLKEAHALLAEAIRGLANRGVHVPRSLQDDFVMLHSYVLAKTMMRAKRYLLAAKLLERCAHRLSRFPTEATQILTTCALTFQRAGANADALRWAKALFQHAEYRVRVDAKFQKRIETIIRKSSRAKQQHKEPPPGGPGAPGGGEASGAPDNVTPCPITGAPTPETQLQSPGPGKEPLPMCVVSGKHLVRGDWTFCPASGFPALRTEYLRYLRAGAAGTAAATDAAKSPRRRDGALEAPMARPRTAASGRRDESVAGSAEGPKALAGDAAPLEGADPVFGLPVRETNIRLAKPQEVDAFLRDFAGTGEDADEAAGAEGAADEKGTPADGGPEDAASDAQAKSESVQKRTSAW